MDYWLNFNELPVIITQYPRGAFGTRLVLPAAGVFGLAGCCQ